MQVAKLLNAISSVVRVKTPPGNSLVVQWLGLCTFTAEGWSSVRGWGTKILQGTPGSQNKNPEHFPVGLLEGLNEIICVKQQQAGIE